MSLLEQILAALGAIGGIAAIPALIVAYIAYQYTRKAPIREVLGVCDRASVKTSMHVQADLDAMFGSLEECRIELQKLTANVPSENQQKRVKDVIGNLKLIRQCNREWKDGSIDEQEVRAKVNPAKTSILATLDELAKDANVVNPLPRTPEPKWVFFKKEEANDPEGMS